MIVVRPDALADIEEAFRWYERHGRGLGEDFLAALQATLDRIAAHPAMYAVNSPEHEACVPAPFSIWGLLSCVRRRYCRRGLHACEARSEHLAIPTMISACWPGAWPTNFEQQRRQDQRERP
jgi:plasmid stabilization system protein ParE